MKNICYEFIDLHTDLAGIFHLQKKNIFFVNTSCDHFFVISLDLLLLPQEALVGLKFFKEPFGDIVPFFDSCVRYECVNPKR